MQPASKTLADKLENSAPIFKNRFQPGESAHLRKINSAETKASDKNIDAVTKRFVAERVHGLLDGLGAIGVGPTNTHFGVRFFDAHLERSMSHRKGYELLPVLRPSEPPGGFQPFVERRRGQRGHQTKNRQARGPGANLLQRSLGHARRVIIHAKNKGRDSKN